MYYGLVAFILVVCLLLAVVVLAQNPKGGGLSSQFGAGSANLIGVKRTGDLLERLTWGFALGLIVLTLGTHILNGTSGAVAPTESVNQRKARETRLPSVPAPAVPGSTAPAAGGATAPAQQPAAPATAPAPANK